MSLFPSNVKEGAAKHPRPNREMPGNDLYIFHKTENISYINIIIAGQSYMGNRAMHKGKAATKN